MPGEGSSGSPRRRSILVPVLVAIALVAGVLVGRALAPERDERDPGAAPHPSEADRVISQGVPLGYPRTEEGAIQAATNFTRVMAAVPDDAEAYLRAAEAMSAPDFRSEARRLAQNGLDFLRERYGQGGKFTFAPVRYRVVSYSDNAATISIWGVTVATGPKVRGLEESWLTGTVDLTWVSDDWRLAGQHSVTGPTPELLHTGDSTDPAALDQFHEYD